MGGSAVVVGKSGTVVQLQARRVDSHRGDVLLDDLGAGRPAAGSGDAAADRLGEDVGDTVVAEFQVWHQDFAQRRGPAGRVDRGARGDRAVGRAAGHRDPVVCQRSAENAGGVEGRIRHRAQLDDGGTTGRQGSADHNGVRAGRPVHRHGRGRARRAGGGAVGHRHVAGVRA